MDTSWMHLKDRTSSQFTKGVKLFLDSIFSDVRPGSFKKCPCARDNDQNEEVTTNIESDDIVGMVQDAMGIPNVFESTDVDKGMMDDETKKALEEIGDVVIPKSYYEANKIVSDLGFSYETWDACPSDCMLFHGDDRFNPFRTMTISHSTWPVVLIPYNLPPWLCMKQPSFILSILIDGPKAPGDKIDVYLQLLIDELKDLWRDGVSTYDASSKSMFQLHAALLWTISDFPAYAKLSGWSTQGRLACPTCNIKTRSFRLKQSRKFCYLGHRRWLKENNKLRRDKAAFNGEPEWDSRPRVLSGSELLDQLKDVETVYKKEDVFKKRKR
ncbi:hypothetical protein Tco_0931286 [Tanacetum coccineum]